VIDRLELAPETRTRIAEAIASGFVRGGGELVVAPVGGVRRRFREGFCCGVCGRRHPAPEPALFSFNSPLGACPACHGFGRTQALDLGVIPDPRARSPRTRSPRSPRRPRRAAARSARGCCERGLATDVAWQALSESDRDWVIGATTRGTA
jgi:excinuclease ABC subunit A